MDDETAVIPPPVLQLSFDSEHGWTVVGQKVQIVMGKDCPEDLKEEFRENTGEDMPDDLPLGRMTIKGRRFESQDELINWLTNVVPMMWEWFVGFVDDIPKEAGMES